MPPTSAVHRHAAPSRGDDSSLPLDCKACGKWKQKLRALALHSGRRLASGCPIISATNLRMRQEDSMYASPRPRPAAEERSPASHTRRHIILLHTRYRPSRGGDYPPSQIQQKQTASSRYGLLQVWKVQAPWPMSERWATATRAPSSRIEKRD